MIAHYHSPIGIIEIMDANGFITAVSIVDKADTPTQALSATLIAAIKQLEEYFEGKRIDFDLPLELNGTAFQQKAWQYLQAIPYGETVSYKEQASAIDSPKAFRAVGSANGKNPIAIIVPCHRVVNQGGALGGYAYGLDVKQQLLSLEQKYKNKQK